VKYILSYESFENEITKIYLVDLYNEIEYHKFDWGNIQREFDEKWFNFNNKFYFISKKSFEIILKIKGIDFYKLKINSFFKKYELEEFLI
jgi:hypothetical protein